jgi:hypothetical protein
MEQTLRREDKTMRAVREIIDSKLISSVIPLPESFRNTKVEVFIIPVQEKQEASRPKKSFLGAFAKYANPSLINQEKSAWAAAAAEKHEYR